MPVARAALVALAAALAAPPGTVCRADGAIPATARTRAVRARVERVAPPERVRVRRARLMQAPLVSISEAHPALRASRPAPARAPGPAPALLVGGQAMEIEQAAFAGDFALVRDARGAIRRFDLGEIDALMLDREATIPEEAAVADFPGGRRIVGAFSPETGSIVHPALGRFAIAGSARLRLLSNADSAALEEPGVVLRNGDILLGAPVILSGGVAIERRDRALLIPWDRVAEVVSGVDEPSARGGLRAHLADGTVVEASSITTRPRLGAIDLTLAGGSDVRLARSALVGLSRVGVDLAALVPGSTFESNAGSLLARPGVHALELPEGARVVRGVVSLPPGARPWGAAYVTIWSAGEPAFFAALDADSPGAAFCVTVDGPLTMTVHPTRNGVANAVAGVTGATIAVVDE